MDITFCVTSRLAVSVCSQTFQKHCNASKRRPTSPKVQCQMPEDCQLPKKLSQQYRTAHSDRAHTKHLSDDTVTCEGLSNTAHGCGAISGHNVTQYLSGILKQQSLYLFCCYFHGHLALYDPCHISTHRKVQSPRELEVRKSVHHHTIQINQPKRCNSFTSLLLDVYVSLNMFRASPRPTSGAYNCINPLKTNRRLLYLKTQSVPRCKHFSSRL